MTTAVTGAQINFGDLTPYLTHGSTPYFVQEGTDGSGDSNRRGLLCSAARQHTAGARPS
jgi:hypothetical protein